MVFSTRVAPGIEHRSGMESRYHGIDPHRRFDRAPVPKGGASTLVSRLRRRGCGEAAAPENGNHNSSPEPKPSHGRGGKPKRSRHELPSAEAAPPAEAASPGAAATITISRPTPTPPPRAIPDAAPARHPRRSAARTRGVRLPRTPSDADAGDAPHDPSLTRRGAHKGLADAMSSPTMPAPTLPPRAPSPTRRGAHKAAANVKVHVSAAVEPLRWKQVARVMPCMDAVVNVFCMNMEPEFSMLWQRKRQYSSSSSGFIIGGRRAQGAHQRPLREHYTQVKLKKCGSGTKYLATVLTIGNDCDMGFLHRTV